MVKSRLNPNVSNPKVFIGLSIFLVAIGIMAMNPLAGFTCFVLAGILMLIACLRTRTRRLRYVAFLLLIIIIALAVWKFSEAGHHLRVYKSKTVIGDRK